ncbi:MAG: carbohydrate porin [Deltaproteobacteria bacterium]
MTTNKFTRRWRVGTVMAVMLAAITAVTLPFGATTFAQDQSGAGKDKGLLPIPDYSGDIWARNFLSGEWDGARNDLAKRGVQFDVEWTQYLQSVAAGGIDTSTLYGGNLAYNLKLDLMRMGVLPGALVQIRAETKYGNTVNGIAGPILPVNTAGLVPLTKPMNDDVAITITDLNYTQFLTEQIGLMIGKFDTYNGDPNEFASGRGISQFMNFNLIFSAPLGILPYSTLGVGALFMPCKRLTISNLVASLNDSSTTTGFDELNAWFWSIEADSQYQVGHLPGGLNAGYVYAWNNNFLNLQNPFIFVPGQGLQVSAENNSWATYFSLWQYLLVEDKVTGPVDLLNGVPDHQGFGLFSRIGFADDKTNLAKFSASLGLGGRGLIPRRDDDLFGIGYYYIKVSENQIGNILGFDNKSQGFEAFYNLAISKSAYAAFDIQVLDAPAPDTDTPVVLGLRLNIRL